MTRSADQWATPPKVPHDHYVSALVYSDPDIFREEQEKIFEKVSKLACHESEVAAPGDYRTVTYAGTPLVGIRGTAGSIRCFLNSGSHLSSPFARAAGGS